MYKYAVIGRGLIGSAAARYLSGSGDSVALIGPDEPSDWKRHQGVFASHYDAARLTRTLDTDPVWAKLAKNSVERYRQIEQQSGISFFDEIGCAKVVPNNQWGRSYIEANAKSGTEYGATFESLSSAEFSARFPMVAYNADALAIVETKNAGLINPRLLVAAQCKLAADAGVMILGETAIECSQASGAVTIKTDAGTTVSAEKVLVAAGAFSNEILLEKLQWSIRCETTVLGRVSGQQAAALKGLMPLICFLPDRSQASYIYLLPPVLYPDGNLYIKIGGDIIYDGVVADGRALRDWFQSEGNSEAVSAYREFLQTFLPKTEFESWHSKPCVITKTLTDRPYVGAINGALFVAAGCCGAAAKSSDEIGKIAAQKMLGKTIEYADAAFRVVSEDTHAGDVSSVRTFQF